MLHALHLHSTIIITCHPSASIKNPLSSQPSGLAPASRVSQPARSRSHHRPMIYNYTRSHPHHTMHLHTLVPLPTHRPDPLPQPYQTTRKDSITISDHPSERSHITQIYKRACQRRGGRRPETRPVLSRAAARESRRRVLYLCQWVWVARTRAATGCWRLGRGIGHWALVELGCFETERSATDW